MPIILKNQIKRIDYFKLLAKELKVSISVAESICKGMANINQNIVANGQSLPIFGIGALNVAEQDNKPFFSNLLKKEVTAAYKYTLSVNPSGELKDKIKV